MSVFYVVFSSIDIILLLVGDLVNHSNSMFVCSTQTYLLPRNDRGAIYMLIDGLIFVAFSYNITHIFYKIPD